MLLSIEKLQKNDIVSATYSVYVLEKANAFVYEQCEAVPELLVYWLLQVSNYLACTNKFYPEQLLNREIIERLLDFLDLFSHKAALSFADSSAYLK